nr:hypothetical protein [Mesorhizobium ciceri]
MSKDDSKGRPGSGFVVQFLARRLAKEVDLVLRSTLQEQLAVAFERAL